MSARALMARIAANPLEILGRRRRTAQQILHGADPWEVIGDPTGTVRRMLVRSYGSDVVRAFERIHQTFQVTPAMAQQYLRWIAERRLVDTYAELRALRSSAGIDNLQDIFEIDHLLEGRLHRMLREGVDGHTFRTAFHPDGTKVAAQALRLEHFFNSTLLKIEDGTAMLVPSNEVAAWRLNRILATELGQEGMRTLAPLLYAHTGIGSKTTRLAQLLPWGLEGIYSYREILDASVWVLVHELGLPHEFGRVVHSDLIQSIAKAIGEDARTAELALPWIRRETGRRLTAESDLLEEALAMALPLRDLAPDFLEQWRYTAPIYLIPFEEATEEIFGIAAR